MPVWRSSGLTPRLAAWIAAALLMPAWITALGQQAPRPGAAEMMNELMSGSARIGGPFTLADTAGRPRSLAEFHGKVVVLYFGYTFCPGICPSDLLQIGRLVELLGPDGTLVQPIFVTLDPERDHADNLGRYAAAFHPRLIALRGDLTETRKVASAFRVFYQKVSQPGATTYVIDHSAFIYLLDQKGEYVAFFPPGTPAERMAVPVRSVLSRRG